MISSCCSHKDAVVGQVEFGQIDTYTPPALVKGSCEQPLTNTTFSKVIDKLQNESEESSRLELTQKILDLNCLTSSQISRLMSLFSFEKNKLNLALSAYLSCYDRDNYFVVSRKLQFEPSKIKLQEYIDGL